MTRCICMSTVTLQVNSSFETTKYELLPDFTCRLFANISICFMPTQSTASLPGDDDADLFSLAANICQ